MKLVIPKTKPICTLISVLLYHHIIVSRPSSDYTDISDSASTIPKDFQLILLHPKLITLPTSVICLDSIMDSVGLRLSITEL